MTFTVKEVIEKLVFDLTSENSIDNSNSLEDYEKEIWVELSNDKIKKVVKEKFLDTWKIDKARYKELVTWISWLLLLWLANLGAEKEEA